MNYFLIALVILVPVGLFVYMFVTFNRIDRCYNNGCSLANQKCKDPNYKCEA